MLHGTRFIRYNHIGVNGHDTKKESLTDNIIYFEYKAFSGKVKYVDVFQSIRLSTKFLDYFPLHDRYFRHIDSVSIIDSTILKRSV